MSDDRPNVHPPLLFQLLQAYYWFDDALQASVRDAGGPNLPRLQSMVLANVAAGVGRPSQIARNLGVSRQALNHLLGELKRKELVELVPDEKDLRAKRVTHHPKSMELVAMARRTMGENEAALLEMAGSTRFSHFLDVLSTVNDLRGSQGKSSKTG